MNQIEVTQADIDAPGNPISNAVKRTFGAYQVSCGLRWCCVVQRRRGEEFVLELNEEARHFVRDFLNHRPLAPIIFPVEFYSAGGLCEQS